MNWFARKKRRQILSQKKLLFRAGRPVGDAAEGARAYRAGKSPTDCPYALGTPEQRAWMIGWEMEAERYNG